VSWPTGEMSSGKLTGRPSSAGGARTSSRPSSAGGARASSRPSSSRTADRSGSVPSNTGLPLTTKLPAELGLAGIRLNNLPANVDTCDQSERCCWRWLAHSVLKEASWLKDELDAVRKEQGNRLAERAKVEHNAEAHAELRGTHAEVQRVLSEARAEICEFRRERAAMRTENATKAAREVELEREVARLEDDRLRTSDREADAHCRAVDSEACLARTRETVEELRKQLSQTEIAQALSTAQLAQVTKERNELQREKEAEKEARRRKRNDRKSAVARHWPIRSKSAPRPQFVR